MEILKKSIVIFVLSFSLFLLTGCVEYNPDYLKTEEYDLDFSSLNSHYNQEKEFIKFVNHVDELTGKTIRVKGYTVTEAEGDVDYHYLIVGAYDSVDENYLEILFSGGYPEDGTDVEITGRVDTYEEDGYLYDCIICNSIEPIEVEE